MSFKHYRQVIAFAGVLVPLTAFAPSAAQAEPGLDSRLVQQMCDSVLRETSALRHLAVLRPVPSGVKSRADIEDSMEHGKLGVEDKNEIDATQLYLRQLDLVPPGYQLNAGMTKLMGEQLGGYYSDESKKFYVTENTGRGELAVVMAHELTHALQDQHFGLKKLHERCSGNDDRRLALKALIEGDATLTMTKFMGANPFRVFSGMWGVLTGHQDDAVLKSTPEALVKVMEFPYLDGAKFVSQLKDTLGWDGVDLAFMLPPASTEQILHFQKYLNAEEPVAVKLPDAVPALGQGWKKLHEDVNGELGLKLILGSFLHDAKAAATAAAGWGGDRYAIYGGPRGATFMVQDTVWDTALDATQWSQAYAKCAGTRLKCLQKSRGPIQYWSDGRKGVWLRRSGLRVLVFEGSVGSFSPEQLFSRHGMQ